MDVLNHPEGKKLLDEIKPDFGKDSQTTNQEMLVKTLRELSGNILSAIPEVKNKSRDDVLRLLDQRLRQIHI